MVEFKPLNQSGLQYALQWKQVSQPWESAVAVKSKPVPTEGTNICKTEAEPLEPGTSYCVRLSIKDGEPGPELVIDTEQVGCTPKSEGCCVVL
jgi:hypothetical protein